MSEVPLHTPCVICVNALKICMRPLPFTRMLPRLHSTGGPRSSETAATEDPTVGLCLGPYGGPREVGCF